jgi:hypothetical protein
MQINELAAVDGPQSPALAKFSRGRTARQPANAWASQLSLAAAAFWQQHQAPLTLVPGTGSAASGGRGARVAAYLAARTINAAEAISEGTPVTINIEACGHFVAIIMLPMNRLIIAPIRPIPDPLRR